MCLAIGTVMAALLLMSSTVSAGTFVLVEVDGVHIEDGGQCDLKLNSEVEGIFRPDVPYQADIDWKLDASAWYAASTTGGASGDIAFWFTMNLNPGPNSVLTIRADESGSFTYWSCHK
jgi:hypothetical protein